MGALRKAGVWLGLIEDDEDGYAERGYDHRGYDDDYEDDEEVAPVAPRRGAESDRVSARTEHTDGHRPHGRLAEAVRAESARAESLRESLRSEPARPPVRSVPRSTTGSDTSYPTRDGLALTPQVHERMAPPPPKPEPEERTRYQITTLHPTTFHEARMVGEHFRGGVPVIMNLTEMAESDARRLVDFAAGLAFGLRGSMERVTNRVFLLSPANVQVTPEDKMKIAEGGFFAS
jgi:cell division inhibitor SepF